MKKITLIGTMLIVVVSSFSQQTNPPPSLVNEDYLQKSKNRKKVASIMLGGGIILTLTGIVMPRGEMISDFWWQSYKNDDIKAAFFLSGVLSMLRSIPFYISSGKKKKQAYAVSFKNEKIPKFYTGNTINHSVPSVNVKISL